MQAELSHKVVEFLIVGRGIEHPKVVNRSSVDLKHRGSKHATPHPRGSALSIFELE